MAETLPPSTRPATTTAPRATVVPSHSGGPYSSLVGPGAAFAGVDQGIDFTGGFDIFALDDGIVTRLVKHGSGWSGDGAVMVYRLTGGSESGRYVYIAEDIVFNAGLGVGSTLTKGTKIARATGSGHAPGIECGWATAAGLPAAQPPALGTPEGYSFLSYVKSGATAAGGTSGNPASGGSSATPGAATDTGSNISAAQVEKISKAAAFASYLSLPDALNGIESESLQGERSLMNDKPLLPFIQQLCAASLRSFQSAPNGDFYAFYPDYFGGIADKTPYWEVHDIEILDATIQLSDDALATHVYAVGDTVGGFDGITTEDKVATHGVVTVFNAFMADFMNPNVLFKQDQILSTQGREGARVPTPDDFANDPNYRGLVQKDKAISFLKKYGARPYVAEVPMIRNVYYEMFLAFQTFCLMWSRQFISKFELTFMPEIYPGGLISFPEHGIQVYVDEVEHDFDYVDGFKTQILVSAPAALRSAERQNVHGGMIRNYPA